MSRALHNAEERGGGAAAVIADSRMAALVAALTRDERVPLVAAMAAGTPEGRKLARSPTGAAPAAYAGAIERWMCTLPPCHYKIRTPGF